MKIPIGSWIDRWIIGTSDQESGLHCKDPNGILPRSRDAFRRVASLIKSLGSPVWIPTGSFQPRVILFLAHQSTVKNTEEIRARPDRSQRDPPLDSSRMVIQNIWLEEWRDMIPASIGSQLDPPTVSALNHGYRIASHKTDGRPRNSESATANN